MTSTTPRDITERLEIISLVPSDDANDFANGVRTGLTAIPKCLPPKYFYDELGSKLFDAICSLPEYYPTRAEDEILTTHADEIAGSIDGSSTTLLEMGSGSAVKTKCIIEALLRRQPTLVYMPIDISRSALEISSRKLLKTFPRLRIEARAGEYHSALSHLATQNTRKRTLALFLGSNVGNFDYDEAIRLLKCLRNVLRNEDALLLGADLKKLPATLEAAYDDPLGVTAAFNLNLLSRINRELDADFDLRSFRHVALFNEKESRIEMHIESKRGQTVAIRKLGLSVEFKSGERIHTENSFKYSLEDVAHLASKSGFDLAKTWFDEKRQFSDNLLVAV